MLGIRNPALKLTGTLQNLINNLLTFIEGQPATCENDGEFEAALRRQARQPQAEPQSDSEEEEEESAEEGEESAAEGEERVEEESTVANDAEDADDEPDFEFTGPGQTVAAFYSDGSDRPCYFVGQVLEVTEDKKHATVTFMSQKGSANVFRWPGSDDIDNALGASYVFCSNFNVGSKGRTWSLDSAGWKQLQLSWSKYIRKYC